jgi:two-component sensor histidine kinase
MSDSESGAGYSSRGDGSKSARLKRVIILPFFIVIVAGFALSWLMYISASRSALRDAVDSIVMGSAHRISEEVQSRLGIAMQAASANAAYLGVLPRRGDDATFIRRAFVDQLRREPSVAILAIGMADGEYLEAQRLSDHSFRVGSEGKATGGTLVLGPVLADGSFGQSDFEASGYDPRARPWYRSAVAAGGPAWSEPYSLYSNAELAVAAAIPVYVDGSIAGVTTATVTLGSLSGYLASMKEAENGLAYVADAGGRLVAVSESSILDADGRRTVAFLHPERLISATAEALAKAAADSTARERDRFFFKLDGKRYLGRSVPFVPGTGLDWTVVLAVAEDAYSGKLMEADVRNMLLLLCLLGLSLLMGWIIVDYITRPIRALADNVDILLPGMPIPEEFDSYSARNNELGRLSRSFVAMKERLDESFHALEASVQEKDVLLKEVHHRVKNNLQVVSSILSIQSGTLEDAGAKAAFEECQNRIQAMALVHEEVYRTGSFVELGMSAYLSRICQALNWGRSRGACETVMDVRVDESSVLPMDKAIPCGLVVNELVTNALKHAFVGREHGAIVVSFGPADAGWRLSVDDDGVGIDATPAGEGAPLDGIGEQLVSGLVAQLRGTIRYETPPGGGTAVIVEFR